MIYKTTPRMRDLGQWHRRFAFFPTPVSGGTNLATTKVWLGFYECRQVFHWGNNPGDRAGYEYRLPGAATTYIDSTYRISGRSPA